VATGRLDRAAGDDEHPDGVCRGPGGAVAVGDGLVPSTGAGPGRRALAWTSRTGATWARATLPAPVDGGRDTVTGCRELIAPPTSSTPVPAGASTSTAPSLVAWGSVTGADGALQPALWQSATGTSWTLRKAPGLGDGPPVTVRDVAVSGSSWLAVGGSATATTDTAAGGVLGVWMSSNGGQAWSGVDTSGPAWQTTSTAALDQAAWLGASAVVAGTVAGQLAVWVSSPLDG
jgi:hypothetical protein